ncbi:MAG: GMC family oxidoreductase [Gemmatimonadetes bacterium]|nr:GMC family oxidoreductase [Gemmatimonadota bacterium]
MPQQSPTPRAASFPVSSTVDFVVVGSGAAGGILAKELSTAGYSVVVLERGPRLSAEQFEHDEFKYFFQNHIGAKTPATWRQTPDEVAKPKEGAVWGAHIVGGSSVHFTANFWRFRPVDFDERSRLGGHPGRVAGRLAHYLR